MIVQQDVSGRTKSTQMIPAANEKCHVSDFKALGMALSSFIAHPPRMIYFGTHHQFHHHSKHKRNLPGNRCDSLITQQVAGHARNPAPGRAGLNLVMQHLWVNTANSALGSMQQAMPLGNPSEANLLANVY